MLRFFPLLLLSLVFLLSALAQAEAMSQPDLISLGVGSSDFDKTTPFREAVDIRAEYRWGLSLVPLIAPNLKYWDKAVQFHPFVGYEGTTQGQEYVLGGYDMDWYMGRHVVFTWSEGFGVFDPGVAFRLGAFGEFRSQAELGWRFPNEMRFSLEASHISNAGMTRRNPGMEIAGVYLHVPVRMIVGQ